MVAYKVIKFFLTPFNSITGFFTIATLIGEVFFHNKHFHAIPGSGVFIIIGAIGAKLLPDGHATMYVVLLHTITLCIMAISTGVPYARQLYAPLYVRVMPSPPSHGLSGSDDVVHLADTISLFVLLLNLGIFH